MKPTKTVFWIVLALLVVGGVVFVASLRAGYETAKYELVSKDGPFEIRQYEAHLVVTTPMQEGGQNGSFGKLFQYISGKNEEEKKIERPSSRNCSYRSRVRVWIQSVYPSMPDTTRPGLLDRCVGTR